MKALGGKAFHAGEGVLHCQLLTAADLAARNFDVREKTLGKWVKKGLTWQWPCILLKKGSCIKPGTVHPARPLPVGDGPWVDASDRGTINRALNVLGVARECQET